MFDEPPFGPSLGPLGPSWVFVVFVRLRISVDVFACLSIAKLALFNSLLRHGRRACTAFSTRAAKPHQPLISSLHDHTEAHVLIKMPRPP